MAVAQWLAVIDVEKGQAQGLISTLGTDQSVASLFEEAMARQCGDAFAVRSRAPPLFQPKLRRPNPCHQGRMIVAIMTETVMDAEYWAVSRLPYEASSIVESGSVAPSIIAAAKAKFSSHGIERAADRSRQVITGCALMVTLAVEVDAHFQQQ